VPWLLRIDDVDKSSGGEACKYDFAAKEVD